MTTHALSSAMRRLDDALPTLDLSSSRSALARDVVAIVDGSCGGGAASTRQSAAGGTIEGIRYGGVEFASRDAG